MQREGAVFFEGTEKKVELIIDGSLPPFRDRGAEYWTRIARACGAGVLSRITNHRCEAYLLSESSLFVFDHKIVMITCGRTHLPAAISELLAELPVDGIEFLIYERKNEAFPHDQPTSFFDDARSLNRRLPGRAFQFGDEDDHHLYLFHLDRPFEGDAQDATLEVLMYGIDPGVLEAFDCSPDSDTGTLRSRTGIDQILAGFELDDHLFEPRGYSLNAIRDDLYWTLHVTPNPIHSYVSFETNQRFRGDREALIGRVLEAFRPRSFDVVTFDRGVDLGPPGGRYRIGSHIERDLSCGYRVRFLSFHRPQPGVRDPIELPLGP